MKTEVISLKKNHKIDKSLARLQRTKREDTNN